MVLGHKTAQSIFRARGGILRTHEALKAGIHPRTLYSLRDGGQVEELTRGVYRLTNLPPLSNRDLAIVGKRVPQGVVCLISALAFHELTTQIPHEVHLALPRNSRTPRLEHPPLRVFRFAANAYGAGVATHAVEGVQVRIYNPEKTLADCFKYRNKIGMEIVLEALKVYHRRRGANPQRVLEYARVCRVESIMRPYLEASV